MKLRILASALVLTAVTAAPASAMISKQDVNSVINSAVANGSLTAVVDGGTVTLIGSVESRYDANKAVNAARQIAGVDRVINHVSSNN